MNTKSDNFNLEQMAIDKATEAAIASKIKSAKKIDVNVDSKVSQMVRGEVNSLQVAGEKIIAFQDIQLEKIDITCDNLSVDLSQAILGKISLNQPGNFKVKIILTESDCDRLLNSEYVRVLLQNLILEVGPESANFYIREAECRFDDEGKIFLIASIVLNRQQQVKTARFEIGFKLYQHGAAIKFDGGKYIGDSTLDLDETVAMMSKICDLLYLRHYSDANLALDITGIEVEAETKQLILRGNAQIKKLSDSITESVKSVASKINHN